MVFRNNFLPEVANDVMFGMTVDEVNVPTNVVIRGQTILDLCDLITS